MREAQCINKDGRDMEPKGLRVFRLYPYLLLVSQSHVEVLIACAFFDGSVLKISRGLLILPCNSWKAVIG